MRNRVAATRNSSENNIWVFEEKSWVLLNILCLAMLFAYVRHVFFFVMLCVGVYVCLHVCVSLCVCGRMCVSVCSYVSKRGTLSQRQGQPPYNLFQA